MTNRTSRSVVSPFLVLFLGIFAVSSAALFIRLAQREAGSLVVAAYRLTLASLVLLPLAWRQRSEFRRLSRAQLGLLALSGLFLAGHFAAWITSLVYTSVASSVVLVTTTPLWVGLFSPFFLGERLNARLWIGLSAAFGGGVLVGVSQACTLSSAGLTCPAMGHLFHGRAFWGNGLALIGALLAAGYMIVGRKLRPQLSLTSYISAVYGCAALALVVGALASGEPLTGFSLPVYGWLVGLALFPQLLGHTSYNYALGYLPAAYVSVAVLAEPVGASILAALVLNEMPTALELVGGLIILVGIGIATWKKA